MNLWILLLLSFAFGFFFGTETGKQRALADLMEQQKQMEATRMWTESFKQYLGKDEEDDDEG